ncbi:MAG: GGDEF-domain containing protein, partial [Actinomycetota bacterium]|nr:GGDEF-domain containing protein [Actinomycetota bacterium]
MRRTTRVLTSASVVAVGLSTWLVAGWGGEETRDIMSNVASVIFAAFATVSAGFAARSARGRKRLAWAFIGLGSAGWVVGSALWMYYELIADELPFPSLADVGFLMFPPAVCIGLLLFLVGDVGHSRTRLVLDGMIAAAALFQISWVAVLRDVYEAGGTSRFAFGLSLAYPIGDLVVITVAVMVLMRARSAERRTLTILIGGVVLMALADSAFVYLSARDMYEGQIGRVVDV